MASLAFSALAVKAWAQAATAAGPAPASAPTSASAAETPATALTAADGRRLYTSFCTRCHGINLVSTSGAYFDLRTLQQSDHERFLRSVSKGLRAMPAWEGTLKPEQMEALWLYVGSVNGWAR
jgi:mono/diheme cytochrome c family protein